MARELVLAWIGRRRQAEWDPLCARYRERLAHHLPVREVSVRPRTELSGSRRLEKEAEAMLQALPEPAWLVVLDRRGRAPSSPELARRLERRLESWPHALAFVVGSDLGVGEPLLSAARERLSLGPLTLPHELARLVLYEQLYRALSISAGIKYHRQSL